MARERILPGQHGDITTVRVPGGWQSRGKARGTDGRLREVRIVRDTKGSAEREARRRLEQVTKQKSGSAALTPHMTVEDLSAYWMSVRSRGASDGAIPSSPRRKRTQRRLSPSTLIAYQSALDHVVIPAFGALRLTEVTTAILDEALAELDEVRSTQQARTVLAQMLSLAVRRNLLDSNPMRDVEATARAAHEIQHLDVQLVHLLRQVLRERLNSRRTDMTGRRVGGRPPNHDLADVVDFALGTGARIGECLAVRHIDVDLAADPPLVHICGTLIEPRRGYVETIHRQPQTKSRRDRTIPLPDAVVETLRRRIRSNDDELGPPGPDTPVFASAKGSWLWPANIRTRLRTALASHSDLRGTTPHTLRRTVGTLVAHEHGLDAARDLLGHSDPSVTFRHYTGRRKVAPDVRSTLDRFFTDGPPTADD